MSKPESTRKPTQERVGVAAEGCRPLARVLIDDEFVKLRADLFQRDQLLRHFIAEAQRKNKSGMVKDAQLRDKEADLRLKDEHVSTLLDLQKRLEVKLVQKDIQIAGLGSEISRVNNGIQSVEQKLREKETFILFQSNQINELRASHAEKVQHSESKIGVPESEAAQKERLNYEQL